MSAAKPVLVGVQGMLSVGRDRERERRLPQFSQCSVAAFKTLIDSEAGDEPPA